METLEKDTITPIEWLKDESDQNLDSIGVSYTTGNQGSDADDWCFLFLSRDFL